MPAAITSNVVFGCQLIAVITVLLVSQAIGNGELRDRLAVKIGSERVSDALRAGPRFVC